MKIWLILSIALFYIIYLAVDVTWKPFSVKLGDWKDALGFSLVLLGILLISISSYERNYTEGYIQGRKDVEKDALELLKLMEDTLEKSKNE